jgi:hypothetical protein
MNINSFWEFRKPVAALALITLFLYIAGCLADPDGSIDSKNPPTIKPSTHGNPDLFLINEVGSEYHFEPPTRGTRESDSFREDNHLTTQLTTGSTNIESMMP